MSDPPRSPVATVIRARFSTTHQLAQNGSPWWRWWRRTQAWYARGGPRSTNPLSTASREIQTRICCDTSRFCQTFSDPSSLSLSRGFSRSASSSRPPPSHRGRRPPSRDAAAVRHGRHGRWTHGNGCARHGVGHRDFYRARSCGLNDGWRRRRVRRARRRGCPRVCLRDPVLQPDEGFLSLHRPEPGRNLQVPSLCRHAQRVQAGRLGVMRMFMI
jgi:hypothetical protein